MERVSRTKGKGKSFVIFAKKIVDLAGDQSSCIASGFRKFVAFVKGFTVLWTFI